jgi:hypothetical protein
VVAGAGAGVCDDDLECRFVRLNESLIRISNNRVNCWNQLPTKTIRTYRFIRRQFLDKSIEINIEIGIFSFKFCNDTQRNSFNPFTLSQHSHSRRGPQGYHTCPSKSPLESDMFPTNDPSWYNKSKHAIEK